MIAHKGGSCILLGNVCTKTGRPLADVFQGKHSNIRIPQVGDPRFSAFERYAELPEMVHLNFLEDIVTWVLLKLLSVEEAMGAEAIELNNWFLRCWCASE